MVQPSTTNHVFISYSRRDEPIMRRVVMFLRKQGINIWLDNEKLVPGTPIWEAEIEKAIINAGAVVVLLSPDSKNSLWVRREISYAEDNDKRIFPILIAGNEKDTIPIRLTNHQRIDIRKNESVGLDSLSASISVYFEELAHNDNEQNATERKAKEKTKNVGSSNPKDVKQKPARVKTKHKVAQVENSETAGKASKKKTTRLAQEKDIGRQPLEGEHIIFSDNVNCVKYKIIAPPPKKGSFGGKSKDFVAPRYYEEPPHLGKLIVTNFRLIFWDQDNQEDVPIVRLLSLYSFEEPHSEVEHSLLSHKPELDRANRISIPGQDCFIKPLDGRDAEELINNINSAYIELKYDPPLIKRRRIIGY